MGWNVRSAARESHENRLAPVATGQPATREEIDRAIRAEKWVRVIDTWPAKVRESGALVVAPANSRLAVYGALVLSTDQALELMRVVSAARGLVASLSTEALSAKARALVIDLDVRAARIEGDQDLRAMKTVPVYPLTV